MIPSERTQELTDTGYVTETPSAEPIRYVAVHARAATMTWRRAVRTALRSVKCATRNPTTAAPVTPRITEAMVALVPSVINHGISGTTAPIANEKNDEGSDLYR